MRVDPEAHWASSVSFSEHFGPQLMHRCNTWWKYSFSKHCPKGVVVLVDVVVVVLVLVEVELVNVVVDVVEVVLGLTVMLGAFALLTPAQEMRPF
jgi:hypothetical protein